MNSSVSIHSLAPRVSTTVILVLMVVALAGCVDQGPSEEEAPKEAKQEGKPGSGPSEGDDEGAQANGTSRPAPAMEANETSEREPTNEPSGLEYLLFGSPDQGLVKPTQSVDTGTVALNVLGDNSNAWLYEFSQPLNLWNASVELLVEVTDPTPTLSLEDPLNATCTITIAPTIIGAAGNSFLGSACARLGQGIIMPGIYQVDLALDLGINGAERTVQEGDILEIVLNTDMISPTQDSSMQLLIGGVEPSVLHFDRVATVRP